MMLSILLIVGTPPFSQSACLLTITLEIAFCRPSFIPSPISSIFAPLKDLRSKSFFLKGNLSFLKIFILKSTSQTKLIKYKQY